MATALEKASLLGRTYMGKLRPGDGEWTGCEVGLVSVLGAEASRWKGLVESGTIKVTRSAVTSSDNVTKEVEGAEFWGLDGAEGLRLGFFDLIILMGFAFFLSLPPSSGPSSALSLFLLIEGGFLGGWGFSASGDCRRRFELASCPA